VAERPADPFGGGTISILSPESSAAPTESAREHSGWWLAGLARSARCGCCCCQSRAVLGGHRHLGPQTLEPVGWTFDITNFRYFLASGIGPRRHVIRRIRSSSRRKWRTSINRSRGRWTNFGSCARLAFRASNGGPAVGECTGWRRCRNQGCSLLARFPAARFLWGLLRGVQPLRPRSSLESSGTGRYDPRSPPTMRDRPNDGDPPHGSTANSFAFGLWARLRRRIGATTKMAYLILDPALGHGRVVLLRHSIVCDGLRPWAQTARGLALGRIFRPTFVAGAHLLGLRVVVHVDGDFTRKGFGLANIVTPLPPFDNLAKIMIVNGAASFRIRLRRWSS